MKPISIVYDDLQTGEKQELCNTLEELNSRLQTITDKYSHRLNMPYGIDLVKDNEDRMSIAFSNNGAFVSYFDNKNAQTLTALGDINNAGNTKVYFGDHTLMPNKFLIPVDIAWHIIDEWCEQDSLSSVIKWTEQIDDHPDEERHRW